MLKEVFHYAVFAQLFNSGEFMLFWRKLQNVAKYAFLVLLFWAKIFICAIFYAYSISAGKQRDKGVKFIEKPQQEGGVCRAEGHGQK